MDRYSRLSSQTDLVVPLDSFSQGDIDQAGGKASNLGELIRARFPVPPGFVITTLAYDRFVAHNGLGGVIAQALEVPSEAGYTIRAAAEGASIPEDVAASVLAAYQQFEEGAVAVRSSATAEDLPEAAFAGQQDTYLNVVGSKALLDAVHRCWASLWTDRAIAYREQHRVDQESVKLAVVVQRMVAAEAAGVMFTANPITGARDEIVIDSSPGLGEAVVSGLVTPDHTVLQRRLRSWRIVERRAGKREVIVRARPGGGTEQVAGPASAESSALPERTLHRLARLGAAIQRHFGSPQDVEWAWAGGELYILQARPMTALPLPPVRANKLQRMIASTIGEMLQIRPYPLDMDTWIPALGGALEPLFGLLGLDWSLRRAFDVQDGVVTRFRADLPRPTWRTLLAPARLAANIVRYNPLLWQADPLLAETEVRARDQAARVPAAISWDQLLATVDEAGDIPRTAGQVRRRYFPGAAFAALRLRLLLGLLGYSDQFGTLLSGAANRTSEANEALEQLAERVRSDPALAGAFAAHESHELWSILEGQPQGRAFLAELGIFLDRYGHRETMISTALQPTWQDTPETVLSIVRGFAAHPLQRPDGKVPWEVARDTVLLHRLLRGAALRSAFLEILAKARTLVQIREDTHFYATLALPLLRRTILEFGTRLVAAGVLKAPEEVFHLQRAELERIAGHLPLPPDLAAELGAAVSRRQARRAKLEGRSLVDERLLLAPSALQGDALLRGMPASPGVAEGPARIVRDASEFERLVPGDILVAPYTNPSWTPLFRRAVAVVVDTGSLGSHAAIVAREYGIPAVMSTVTGTRELRDGQRIRVDGSQGTVYSVATELVGREE